MRLPAELLTIPLALGLLLVAAPAAAQHVEVAGRVTASRTVLTQRRVGEPRYLAISDLFYRDRFGVLEVLDLDSQTVTQVRVKRTTLERRFGAVRDGATTLPQGEIAVFRDGVIGVVLSETVDRTHRYWYAELDVRSGKLLRSVDLAVLRDSEQLQIVGADATGESAWVALTERVRGGRVVVLRRIELATLTMRDEQRIALSPSSSGHDHAVQVHGSADLTQFAIVEYVEDGVAATGQVFIADPAAGTSFAVPAPPTAYGVAFAPDGKYVYLGSAQRGTISRIDVTAGRIDKQVAAPRYLHHLIVSPNGNRLFAFASSSRYAVYDLPDLKGRSDNAHPAGMAAAMAELHGDGGASIDGAFFVVPEAEDRRSPPAERTYVIARLVD